MVLPDFNIPLTSLAAAEPQSLSEDDDVPAGFIFDRYVGTLAYLNEDKDGSAAAVWESNDQQQNDDEYAAVDEMQHERPQEQQKPTVYS